MAAGQDFCHHISLSLYLSLSFFFFFFEGALLCSVVNHSQAVVQIPELSALNELRNFLMLNAPASPPSPPAAPKSPPLPAVPVPSPSPSPSPSHEPSPSVTSRDSSSAPSSPAITRAPQPTDIPIMFPVRASCCKNRCLPYRLPQSAPPILDRPNRGFVLPPQPPMIAVPSIVILPPNNEECFLGSLLDSMKDALDVLSDLKIVCAHDSDQNNANPQTHPQLQPKPRRAPLRYSQSFVGVRHRADGGR